MEEMKKPFRKGKGGRKASTMLCDYLETHVRLLEEQGKLGTSRNYRCALHSLRAFLQGRDVRISGLKEPLVVAYDHWLRRREVTRNTVSFYMRILRAVYNKAVKERLARPAVLFGNVYTGVDRTGKRAVGVSVLKAMQQLDLSGDASLEKARDLFVFSFFARGMAFVDMAYLCKKDIQADSIVYVRRKTSRKLSVRIEPCIRLIMDRYAKETSGSPYVFPLLRSADTAQAYSQYKNSLGWYNRSLKVLARILGIERLSSYTARHTWATSARDMGIPLSIISAGMGHSSERTTEIYLASLDNSVIDRANRKILQSLAR